MKGIPTIVAFIAIFLFSCTGKPTVESVANFDMSTFCDDYYVLKYPNNTVWFVFIDKKNLNTRFSIFKVMNSKMRIGYKYGIDFDDSMTRDTYNSAEEAVEKAVEIYDDEKLSLANIHLKNIMPLGNNEWVDRGTILTEICPAGNAQKPSEKKETVESSENNPNEVAGHENMSSYSTENIDVNNIVDLTNNTSSLERKTIIDAIRPKMEAHLKQKIKFQVNSLEVLGDFAVLRGIPKNATGGQVDYIHTIYQKDIEQDSFNDYVLALCKKENGAWVCVDFKISCTDFCTENWPEKYGVPKSFLYNKAL